MHVVACYGRWERQFDLNQQIDRVEFIGPDGSPQVRPTYTHQPAELVYDDHGYEIVKTSRTPVTAVRFTGVQVGTHRYRAMRDQGVVEQGEIAVGLSDHPGFVQVSGRDSRYFAYSNGQSYCPIGLNLVGTPSYPLPKGREHFATSGQRATMGCREYARWLGALSRNGGNFARLWLSHPYFNVEGETAGELDLAGFAKLDAVVELARAHGVRLKLCFEHFRVVKEGQSWAYKCIRHPVDGREPASMDEWFTQETWRQLWLKKVDAYLARYGDDPVVMAWELWNEINCCQTSDWAIQRQWTRDMLAEIKRRSPRNLVTNSLGSLDYEESHRLQRDFHMAEMDFQQVHRYLDQGAGLEICRTDPVAFSIDAVVRARREDRPILLAETGAVNDSHTGPFRFYRWDERGIIFADTTFPAFFAGAAGTGHIWHWDEYVDQKDLWRTFGPFARLVDGIQLDVEGFRPADLSSEQAWVLLLCGQKHMLGLVRNKADRWDRVLRDGQQPPVMGEQVVDLLRLGAVAGRVTTCWLWPEESGDVVLENGRLKLPPFRYGMMVRVDR